MPDELQVRRTDTLVLGTGLAGLYAALRAAHDGDHRVTLVTRGALRESSSFWAQGGVAAAIGQDDTAELHEADTMRVGRGLCREDAVELLTEEAPFHLARLRELGVDFERHGEALELALEAGHSRRRIAHAGGGGTGRVIMEAVVRRVLEHPAIDVLDGTPAWGLASDGERCHGAHVADGMVLAPTTILATGGTASLFARSTNPPGSRGQGVAMAWRIGAAVADMEFVQFHPTALALAGHGDSFLISEAVRGEGAHLLDSNGVRFMPDVNDAAELAPRDELSRAIVQRIEQTGHHCVYLSLAHLDPATIHVRFGSIAARLADLGFDMARDLLPVAPAAHFMMGGVLTDLDSATTVPGLLACGEVACTGVHGANRLASNSLLECLVFADRAGRVAARAAADERASLSDACIEAMLADRPPLPERPSVTPDLQSLRELLWRSAGVTRDAASLRAIEALAGAGLDDRLASRTVPADVLVAGLIARAALIREESRGGHWRGDFPTERAAWQTHIVQQVGGAPRIGMLQNFDRVRSHV